MINTPNKIKTDGLSYPVYTDETKPPIIVLSTCKGIMAIPVQQIIRIQSISNYSKLFFKDGKTLVVAKVLHWFQNQSCLFSFVRIHRTHFVNINYIKSYSGSKTGLLFLLNGEKFSVAKRKKAAISKKLNNINNFFSDEPVCTPLLNAKEIYAA